MRLRIMQISGSDRCKPGLQGIGQVKISGKNEIFMNHILQKAANLKRNHLSLFLPKLNVSEPLIGYHSQSAYRSFGHILI